MVYGRYNELENERSYSWGFINQRTNLQLGVLKCGYPKMDGWKIDINGCPRTGDGWTYFRINGMLMVCSCIPQWESKHDGLYKSPWIPFIDDKHDDLPIKNDEINMYEPSNFWLVGGFNPPLWKMMEWRSVGMMTFPKKNGTIKFMFQITNQICIHFLTNPSLLTGTIFSNYPFSWVQVQTNLNSNPDFTKKWLWRPRISSQAGLTAILKGKWWVFHKNFGSFNYDWLVVYLPLWKIWVRQLGWIFPTYGKIEFMFQTTNQMNIEPAMDLGYLSMNQGDPRTHGTTASCNVHDSQLVFHINQWKPTLHQIGQTPNFLGSPYYWHIPHVSWVRQPPIGWQKKTPSSQQII